MAKQRYINTEMWVDNWFSDLDPIEKLLFMYLLTNDATNIAGVYQLPTRRIAADTGIDRDMVNKIMIRFAQAEKIIEWDGWIIIVNHLKHQNLDSNSTIKGLQRIIDTLPDSVKKILFPLIGGLQGAHGGLAYLNLNLNLNLNLDLTGDAEESASCADETVLPVIDSGACEEPEKAEPRTTTHQAIKRIFDQGSSALSSTGKAYYHDAREAKAVKHLEARYRDGPEHFEDMARRFFKLIKSGDKFWGGQPFTPSVLMSLWNRIESAKLTDSGLTWEEKIKIAEEL